MVEPTAEDNGYTLHECACGYSYQDTPVAALGITNPTANGTAANTVVYDYVYSGSSLSYLTVTSTNFGADPVTEELYFGNGTVAYGDDVYYYVTNLQGDVVAIIDADGNVLVEYCYDAWGKILSISGPMADTLGAVNPLTYRGYVYDTETDLYYLESRYYDPAVERFINGDGAYDTNQGFLGYNLYIYCLNNSVNMYDPNGRCGRFLGFLWKVDCGQASCPDSKYYVKPKTIDPIGTYNNGQGYVYVVTENQLASIMQDKEDNVVVILDKRTDSDPNMQIQDSYMVSYTSHQREIAQLMIDYNAAHPVDPAWSRTLDSIVNEWIFHNLAYAMMYKRERTGDCDFNNADEGKDFWDYIGR